MGKTTPRSESGIEGIAVERKPGEYYLELPKIEGLDERTGVVVLIRGLSLGNAGELGTRLLGMFLSSLCEMPPVVRTVVLVNEGVNLACESSPVLNALETLEKQGTEILCCSTSCNHYKVEPLVGVRSSMFHIADVLLAAGKVITL